MEDLTRKGLIRRARKYFHDLSKVRDIWPDDVFKYNKKLVYAYEVISTRFHIFKINPEIWIHFHVENQFDEVRDLRNPMISKKVLRSQRFFYDFETVEEMFNFQREEFFSKGLNFEYYKKWLERKNKIYG